MRWRMTIEFTAPASNIPGLGRVLHAVWPKFQSVAHGLGAELPDHPPHIDEVTDG